MTLVMSFPAYSNVISSMWRKWPRPSDTVTHGTMKRLSENEKELRGESVGVGGGEE